MIKFSISETEIREFESLNELFNAPRDKRNELFGSYLTEGDFEASTVQKKVDEKIKAYEIQLQNLKTLNRELKKVVTEENVQKMLKDVEEMNQEQAEALLEKLKAKLNQ